MMEFSGTQQIIMRMLIARSAVTVHNIVDVVYGARNDGDIPQWPVRCIHVILLNLRRKLEKHDVHMTTWPGGRGNIGRYFLTPEQKKVVRGLLARCPAQEHSCPTCGALCA